MSNEKGRGENGGRVRDRESQSSYRVVGFGVMSRIGVGAGGRGEGSEIDGKKG